MFHFQNLLPVELFFFFLCFSVYPDACTKKILTYGFEHFVCVCVICFTWLSYQGSYGFGVNFNYVKGWKFKFSVGLCVIEDHCSNNSVSMNFIYPLFSTCWNMSGVTVYLRSVQGNPTNGLCPVWLFIVFTFMY